MIEARLGWQKRVLLEREELETKLKALKAFLNEPLNSGLSYNDYALLGSQQNAMQAYLDLLDRRIERFT